MAREMAVVLAYMRPEGKKQHIALEKWAWILMGGAAIIGLIGLGGILWVLPAWSGAGVGGLWVALMGLGMWGLWRLWRETQRYRETVQVQAREEILRVEGRYKALVQYASEIFMILSKDAKILFVSPSVSRVLGYTPAQLEGTLLKEYLHSEDAPLVETALARQSSAFFTVRLQHREGMWRYYEAVGQPLFSDAMIGGYLITLRDVSDRKREEEQRREKEAAALRLAVERERAEYEKSLIEQSKRQLEEAYKIIEQKNKEIEESLQYAARIQQGMIAPPAQLRRYFPQSFILWLPRDVVSGDFYWFLPLEDRTYLAVADCTGHGVPGALMTMISSAILTQAVLGEGLRDPDQILARVHQLMRRALRQDVEGSKSQDGMDIALIAYEFSTKKIYYAGANRPLWLVQPGASELIEIKADRKGIGGAMAPPEHFFTLHILEPPKGSWIYASSDGYQDQFSKEGRKYMSKRFKHFIYQISSLSWEAQLEALRTELEAWKGTTPQTDDILVAGFQIQSP
ncbi:MAG: SpoIIE family protein phosphatase [Bacteroidia bacterium]|nr:SpoIIE family protein phosphatase [Bacteroidia bacterium]MDW8134703.1 SpoIIE family protein phosphatase [Bacteroidia bacterium]